MKDNLEKDFLIELKEAAPESLSCFIEFMTPDEPPARHHEFMCDHLEAIERRDILRATFSMPPGHAKTKICSRYFSAWYLGRNPNHKYLQGGHSQNFAETEFGRPVRDIITDPKFQQVFPGIRLSSSSKAGGNWRLHGLRGGYVAKGVGQSIAGYRANCAGIDDPFGSREDAQSAVIRERTRAWLFTDFRTRLLPFSPLFIVATRWHQEDLIGMVEQYSKNGKGIPWTIINLNAIIETEEEMLADPMGRDLGEPLWPEFYGLDELLELKSTLPQMDWWALYKGKPRNEEGNVIKATWFRRYKRLPINGIIDGQYVRQIRRVTVSVDCANKATQRANYTVATVWIEDTQRRHYLAHVERRRVELPELIPMIENLATHWGAHQILVEDAGAGSQYIQLRRGLAPCPVVAVETSNKSKEFRFDACAPMIEAGEVYIPDKTLGLAWLEPYEEELLSFPNGSSDDQVDSTSQYLAKSRVRGNYGARKIKGVKLSKAA